jgi:tRNA(adenine34) deaminase
MSAKETAQILYPASICLMIFSTPFYRITIMPDDEKDIYFMKIALEEAQRAFDKGEVPVGAVLVHVGSVIAKAHNNRETSKDPTAHAEILVLRAGVNEYTSWRLTDAVLYVTKEPCIMCAGAMLNARLGRLVYACKDEKGGAVDTLYSLLSDIRLNHRVEVTSGVLENECAEILQRFFKLRRVPEKP